MTIVDIILFALTTIGLTHLLVDGDIFDPLRQGIRWFLTEFLVNFLIKKIGIKGDKFKERMMFLNGLFNCHHCMGTWCGFLCGYVFLEGSFWQILLYGAAGGFLAKLAGMYLIYLESQSTVSYGD